jgi:hypothetical protein
LETIHSPKLTVRPCHELGGGRSLSTKKGLFSGSNC